MILSTRCCAIPHSERLFAQMSKQRRYLRGDGQMLLTSSLFILDTPQPLCQCKSRILSLPCTMTPALLHPLPPSQTDFKAFLDRHAELLHLERAEEEDQTRLLNSNCSAKELERKGLSLGGLGVSNINIGLGGKSYVTNRSRRRRYGAETRGIPLTD